jgi:hypothetical protein
MAKTDTPSKSKKSSNSDSKTGGAAGSKGKADASTGDVENVSDSEASGVLAKFMKGLKEAVGANAVGAKVEAPVATPKVTTVRKKSAATPSTTPSTLMSTEKVVDVPPTAPMPPLAPLDPNAQPSEDDEVILTDAEGRRYCRATDCDQIGTVDGYCRFHYLLYWKKIQNRKRILADGKLERYIEELTARYTDKFVELLRKDLRTEKDFMAALQELELDDSAAASAGEEDEAKTYIEEISGVAAPESRDDEGF